MLTLEWIGKNKVVNHHQEVPFRVLERQYSFGEQGQHTENNDSENMIIHGDNLEALKALLPQYEGKVKCIYIVILTPILMSILSSENAVRLNFIIHIPKHRQRKLLPPPLFEILTRYASRVILLYKTA